MRQKQEAVLRVASDDEGPPKVACEDRARYRAIRQLVNCSTVVPRFCRRCIRTSSRSRKVAETGARKRDFTSENI